MGSEFNPCKRPYDLSMSKRTRKPWKLEKTTTQLKSVDSSESVGITDHKSLRELINDGNGEKVTATKKKQNVNVTENEGDRKRAPEENGRRNSLQHYLKEEQEDLQLANSLQHYLKEEQEDLQLVTLNQQREGMAGVKLGGMVGRYVKVLGHLIKIQREPCLGSRKEPVLRLKM